MDDKNQERWGEKRGALDNGLPFSVRFREDLPDEREIKKLSTLIVVSWLLESADGNGLPNEDELDEMEFFENLMDEALVEKGTARLMTVFTGEGVREWQFYTDDEEFFMRKFNEAMEGKPVLPIEIEAFEDENWDAYRDFAGTGSDE
jgi:hypothetical protein